MKKYDHIIRFAVVLGFVIVGFFTVRTFMVPESFGVHGSYMYGYHRGTADAEQAALPASFQGAAYCSSCHDKQSATWNEGGHAGVGCESCHGHFRAHNENAKDVMAITPTPDTCLICHRKLAARPDSLPQIPSFAEHLADQGETLRPELTCTECHDPHEPM